MKTVVLCKLSYLCKDNDHYKVEGNSEKVHDGGSSYKTHRNTEVWTKIMKPPAFSDTSEPFPLHFTSAIQANIVQIKHID